MSYRFLIAMRDLNPITTEEKLWTKNMSNFARTEFTCHFLPHRKNREVSWGLCGAVNECMMLSDCGTSHRLLFQSAERSPGYKNEVKGTNRSGKVFDEIDENREKPNNHDYTTKTRQALEVNYINSVFKLLIDFLYLRVNTKIFSRGKSQSQEVVTFPSFLSIIFHQLPQLLHNLIIGIR